MSIADYPLHNDVVVSAGEDSREKRKLNRIRETRKRQGISLRSVSRRMHVETRKLREEEDPRTDLTLSDLYRWQQALEVPAAELLDESDEPISRPVLERARLVRLMKTAAAIAEKAQDASMLRLARTLRGQLLEIMPELTDITAWHSVGQRRTLEDMGKALDRCMPDDFFPDSTEH